MNLPALPQDIKIAQADLPAVYERAKLALTDCAKIDECADWSNKAAALGSYARQANDDELEKLAMRIRARAIRRCGELLQLFDGRGDHRKVHDGVNSSEPSRQDMAEQAGLSRRQRDTGKAEELRKMSDALRDHAEEIDRYRIARSQTRSA